MSTEADPYQRPDAPLADQLESQPVGFWKRVLASIIDTILLILITWPILYTIYGGSYFSGTQLSHGVLDFLLTWFFPAVAGVVYKVYDNAQAF